MTAVYLDMILIYIIESKQWRSGLRYENVVNIPQIQQLVTENKVFTIVHKWHSSSL